MNFNVVQPLKQLLHNHSSHTFSSPVQVFTFHNFGSQPVTFFILVHCNYSEKKHENYNGRHKVSNCTFRTSLASYEKYFFRSYTSFLLSCCELIFVEQHKIKKKTRNNIKQTIPPVAPPKHPALHNTSAQQQGLFLAPAFMHPTPLQQGDCIMQGSFVRAHNISSDYTIESLVLVIEEDHSHVPAVQQPNANAESGSGKASPSSSSTTCTMPKKNAKNSWCKSSIHQLKFLNTSFQVEASRQVPGILASDYSMPLSVPSRQMEENNHYNTSMKQTAYFEVPSVQEQPFNFPFKQYMLSLYAELPQVVDGDGEVASNAQTSHAIQAKQFKLLVQVGPIVLVDKFHFEKMQKHQKGNLNKKRPRSADDLRQQRQEEEEAEVQTHVNTLFFKLNFL